MMHCIFSRPYLFVLIPFPLIIIGQITFGCIDENTRRRKWDTDYLRSTTVVESLEQTKRQAIADGWQDVHLDIDDRVLSVSINGMAPKPNDNIHIAVTYYPTKGVSEVYAWTTNDLNAIIADSHPNVEKDTNGFRLGHVPLDSLRSGPLKTLAKQLVGYFPKKTGELEWLLRERAKLNRN